LKTQSHFASTTSLPSCRLTAISVFLVALAVFAGLWLLNLPYRQAYQPSHDDVTALADGLLLLPGARWTDWFSQGHSLFFVPYPEWSIAQTGFARPVFQFVIYLAHFALDRQWAAYLAINYLGIAGIAAVAFAIARIALRLGVTAALFAAALVLTAPAVSEFSIAILGAASESLAAVFVGCAFLALIAERQALCFLLLLIAVFTKETALWAPAAAAATLILQSPGSRPRGRPFIAATMLLPIAIWLAFRLAFYGGIGGTYATAGYASARDFMALLGWKLIHFHPLFVSQQVFFAGDRWSLIDQSIRIATALLLLASLAAWALHVFAAARAALGRTTREQPASPTPTTLLVTLWAVFGLAFYLILAVGSPRYATAAVMFAWPAIVHAILRHRRPILRAALALCLALSVSRTAHFLVMLNPPRDNSETAHFFHAIGAMNAALSQAPPRIRQIYVISEDGMVPITPDYLRAFLGIEATIIRVADISWGCSAGTETVAFSHSIADGVTTLDATLPDCAHFFFFDSPIEASALQDGLLPRNDAMIYELPDSRPSASPAGSKPLLELGRRMILRVRSEGPARFIIEHGQPDDGLAWFDTP
jgi:hypothetical protein